jgi:hypothetical protein
MTSVWALRQEALLNDCIVSPDVFASIVDRLCDFVVPYQHALETVAGKRHVHLYLAGLLSHLDRKNAEKIAVLVDVERLVMQAFIGTAPWDHRPLIQVLVGQVVDQLGEPDGVIAFDPSSFPKRGTHSVGVKRQWCSHRGKVDNCQVGVYMGYIGKYLSSFPILVGVSKFCIISEFKDWFESESRAPGALITSGMSPLSVYSQISDERFKGPTQPGSIAMA